MNEKYVDVVQAGCLSPMMFCWAISHVRFL